MSEPNAIPMLDLKAQYAQIKSEVDEAMARVSHRLGLTAHADPVKIERDLMALVPKKDWTMFAHRMIFHGRQVCFARKPNCPECILREVCPKIGVEIKKVKQQTTKGS